MKVVWFLFSGNQHKFTPSIILLSCFDLSSHIMLSTFLVGGGSLHIMSYTGLYSHMSLALMGEHAVSLVS